MPSLWNSSTPLKKSSIQAGNSCFAGFKIFDALFGLRQMGHQAIAPVVKTNNSMATHDAGAHRIIHGNLVVGVVVAVDNQLACARQQLVAIVAKMP